jgi:hypothetical protein
MGSVEKGDPRGLFVPCPDLSGIAVTGGPPEDDELRGFKGPGASRRMCFSSEMHTLGKQRQEPADWGNPRKAEHRAEHHIAQSQVAITSARSGFSRRVGQVKQKRSS